MIKSNTYLIPFQQNGMCMCVLVRKHLLFMQSHEMKISKYHLILIDKLEQRSRCFENEKEKKLEENPQNSIKSAVQPKH